MARDVSRTVKGLFGKASTCEDAYFRLARLMFIAWTTVADRATADQLAAESVRERLAVCVQVEGPVTSHYRWQGAQEAATEFRLMFKASTAQLPALARWLHERHPYETPEWIVVRCEQVGEKYLSWAMRTLDS